MPLEFPRFNQNFVTNLSEGSDEARFVSSVGDYTFLGRQHADKIDQISRDLRRPVTLGLFTDQKEFDTYVEQFSENFETLLNNDGFSELVFALNSLKVATDALRGRKLTWVSLTSFTNEATIVGSNIGFDFHSLDTPALKIELSDGTEEDSTYLSSLPLMWDIDIK